MRRGVLITVVWTSLLVGFAWLGVGQGLAQGPPVRDPQALNLSGGLPAGGGGRDDAFGYHAARQRHI